MKRRYLIISQGGQATTDVDELSSAEHVLGFGERPWAVTAVKVDIM